MPRKPDAKAYEELVRPKPPSTVQYPANEMGRPLTMELHEPTLPASSVPYLKGRFAGVDVSDLAAEHDGKAVGIDAAAGREKIAREGNQTANANLDETTGARQRTRDQLQVGAGARNTRGETTTNLPDATTAPS